MSSFAQSFWSSDYAGGLGVLFGKLQQGVQENQQFLTIARMRADAEDMYGSHMGDIGPATDKIQGGFQKDDGASVRKAYEGVRAEMAEASRKHRKIASNIRELVVYPFSRWSDQHATRVQNSQDDLQRRVKEHDKQAESVRKLRSQYFNKCRLVEDLEEEDKLAFKEPQVETSPSDKPIPPIVKVQEPESEDEAEPIDIGEQVYTPDQIKKVLTHMLENIRLTETKVSFLGTYQNVSTGAEIVEYIQKSMGISSMALAERIGQDMIGHGFLRLVGSVGSTFANSSRLFYQWRPKVFQITGIPEKRKPVERSGTGFSLDSIDSPLVGTVNEYISNWNPLVNAHPNEAPSAKSKREAREADERYKSAVRKLDLLRCALEEAIFEHLKFMERCELDRLKAIKSVILDFSGAISNVIPSLQSTIDKMMLFQETVQPLGDLRYLLENYRTGAFVPKVQIYENYYNSVDDQTFGVDLEARAKADRKRVPLLITSVLTCLDQHYPQLEGDEARRSIWLVDVPLAATHLLRSELNNGKPVPPEILDRYEVPVIAALLKLYLLELPDSIVPSSLYEVMKTIYSTPATADPSATATRISILQNTLGQLRLANIASLDAITTHFARLIGLTSADDEYITRLTQSLAPCILRPRTETSLTLEEKYNYRFLRDLLEHKEPIFRELKRAISLNRTMTVTPATSSSNEVQRPRAISTDESNRRANFEERARALAANRSRTSSPAPHAIAAQLSKDRGDGSSGAPQTNLDAERIRNRRESSRGPETRFPVNATASPRGPPPGQAQSGVKSNLEIPVVGDGSPVRERDRDRDRDRDRERPISTRLEYGALDSGTSSLYGSGSVANGHVSRDSTSSGTQSSELPMTTTTSTSFTYNTQQQGQGQHPQSRQPSPPSSYTAPNTATTTDTTAASITAAEVEKRNSLGRSTATAGRFVRKQGTSPMPGGAPGHYASPSVGLARQRLEKRESMGASIGASMDRGEMSPISALGGGGGGNATWGVGGIERAGTPALSAATAPSSASASALGVTGAWNGRIGGGGEGIERAGTPGRVVGVELVDKPMDD